MTPNTVIAGTKITWTNTFNLFNNTQYDVKYVITDGISSKTATAEAGSGDYDYIITFDANDTKDFIPGIGKIVGYAIEKETGEPVQIYNNNITITPNYLDNPLAPIKSKARITLEALETAIQEYAEGGGVAALTISTPGTSRSQSFSSISDLLAIRNHYVNIVNKEEEAAALANGQIGKKRFLLKY